MALNADVGWGIVGCGRVAERRLAPVFSHLDGTRIAAVCSRSLDRARQFAERFLRAEAYSSLDALLADTNVHVVYIATPNAMHAEMALKCLAAGKHVVVEKPMALTSADAQAMVKAAKTAKRLLSVMHQQRFHPANMHLIRLVDEGRLGRVNVIRMQIGMWYPPSDNWRLTRALSGGGVVMDLGPHALDLMLELGGPLRQVSATARNMQFQYEVEDFCAARLEFSSGAVGLLDLAYCYHDYGGRIEVFGSEGTYAARGSLQQAVSYQTWLRVGQREEPAQEDSYADAFRDALEDVTDAVQHRGDPSITASDGVRVVRAIEAIYESAREGRPVELAGRSPS